uniref:WD40 repeat domain-containing protein n=1 Tax=candidate division CPR3 bacterium TaxID=2268181 RepID=A0A7C4M317_UNCC3
MAKKIVFTLIIVFVSFFCKTVLADDTIFEKSPILKSPDKKFGASFECSLSNERNSGNCMVFLYESNIPKKIDSFSLHGTKKKKVKDMDHFCHFAWNSKSTKLVYYCVAEQEYSDFALLNVFDLKTGQIKDLSGSWIDEGVIKGSYGDEVELWRLIKVKKERKCLQNSDLEKGKNSNQVFMKLEGSKLTFHLMRFLTPAEIECSGDNCLGSFSYKSCPTPKSSKNQSLDMKIVSVITQDIDTGKVARKNQFFFKHLIP